MYDGIFIGASFGAALIGVGLMLGWRMARRNPPAAALPQDAEQFMAMMSRMMRFTDNFTRDVSEYRNLIATATQQAEKQTPEGGAPSAFGLPQIVEANELLRLRLEEAETTLACQSRELSAYMTEARTDALTGLPNRRALNDELARRIAAFRRHSGHFSLLVVDIDRFKQFNDRYGHQTGDAVLVHVAKVMRAAIRECDLVARFGGEEFVAIITTTGSREESERATYRVRTMVEESECTVAGKAHRVTLSCGVAAITPEETAAALVARADAALYASKGAGRNCSHWHDGRTIERIALEIEQKSPVDMLRNESFREVCTELRRKLLESPR